MSKCEACPSRGDDGPCVAGYKKDKSLCKYCGGDAPPSEREVREIELRVRPNPPFLSVYTVEVSPKEAKRLGIATRRFTDRQGVTTMTLYPISAESTSEVAALRLLKKQMARLGIGMAVTRADLHQYRVGY